MSTVDTYISAATRENTRRSYRTAIQHFEVQWGGFLPASADAIARYLADHAATLSANTLQQRLAALASWHHAHGFPDPTKTHIVRGVLKGIRALHPAQQKQARPLQLEQLRKVASWLDDAKATAKSCHRKAAELRYARDRALLLVGFWRGFRGDELARMQIEHIEAIAGEGIAIYLPQSKSDRNSLGRTFKAPALKELCPVKAYVDWIELAGLISGPVFRGIDRWGNLSDTGLHINSLIPLLRSLFEIAGIALPEQYSGHSLRRGFATWAGANGWDLKTLMEYVGWRDVQSAVRYMESADPFAKLRL